MILRNYADALNPKSLLAAAVLAATNTGTTGVDMGTTRHSLVNINFTKGTDVPTSFIIQDSPNDSDWTDHTTVDNSDLAATAFVKVQVTRHKRYLRIKWVRGSSSGDSYWSVNAIGYLMRQAPA